jgi:D-alanyl-D-alanine dipeptidase
MPSSSRWPLGKAALAAALAASTLAWAEGPPREKGPFRKPDLVEIASLDSSIHLDIRYATANNFTGRAVYTEARAFLQRPAADALLRAARDLAPRGYGLLIFDGYRPWSVTKLFWDIVPPEKHWFVANPAKGSKHNRGCAVDLTLYLLDTGHEVEMPSAYDEISKRAHPSYRGGPAQARATRDLLRAFMEKEGFGVDDEEWWHFNFRDWKQYPILDIPFDAIPKSSPVP